MGDVYSGNKIFHFPQHLARVAAGEMPPPIHVRLKPTNCCNQRCGYCCYRSTELLLSERMRESDAIPRDKMGEIVTDLVNMGVRAVTFSGGGEPLCYPYFVETVRALIGGGVKVAVLTNGSLLKGEVAGLLAQHATWVRVSIDAADPSTYSLLRSVPANAFEQVCENMRTFAATPGRNCVLGANFIVTQENSNDVLRFLGLAHELGVDHVKVSAAVVSTDPIRMGSAMSGYYDAVKSQIREAQQSLADSSFSIIDKFHLPDATHESYDRGYTWCPMAHFLTVIAADMNVYTCQDKAYTSGGLLGSLRGQAFSDLWASSALRERMRQLVPRRDCGHHCVSHGKNLSLLDFFEADGDHLDFV